MRKKQTVERILQTLSKRLSGTCWITPGAVGKKKIFKRFGWTFQTLILHFSRGMARGRGSDDRGLDSVTFSAVTVAGLTTSLILTYQEQQ